ncbi:MAG TPA: DUF5683 domain-containing protein [Chitinophagaceae bacterium]|nr:DUF5683 domain-containing protein [Chitinophagaceae bacterium]
MKIHPSNKIFIFVLLFSCSQLLLHAQEPVKTPATDSVPTKIIGAEKIPATKRSANRYDSSIKAHSPRKAALRSAVLPGLGQIYNKKYWKLPIIYGIMGTSAGIFIFNLKQYKDTRFAYRVKYNMRVNRTDSALYVKIKDNLKPLGEESLRFYRNQYRRDIDYSALVFILLWGLNIVDAAVDAHLKGFDVSPDLSLYFKPGYSELAGTNGLSLVLKIGR